MHKILRAQSCTSDLSRPARSFHRMASRVARHALFALVAASAALSPAAAQQLPQVTITGPASVREGDRFEVTVRRTGPTTASLTGGLYFVDTASNGDFDDSYTFVIQVGSATATVRFTAQSDGVSADDRTITVSVSTLYDTYSVGTPASVTVTVTDENAAVANVAATGTPTISGTAQVGQVLTAGPGDIADANGLTSPVYSYQWLRADTASAAGTAISGATGATYTLADADQGKYIRVRLSFTDDASNPESRTSGATQEVTTTPGAPRTLAATPGVGQVVLRWTVPASDGGAAIMRYEYRHKATSAGSFPATWTSAGTALTATVGLLTNGTPYDFEVRAVNTVGAGTAATTSATPTATPQQPTLTLDVDPNRFGEADGTVIICVLPSAVSSQRITVHAATADGTATAPGDYSSYSSTVALQPQLELPRFGGHLRIWEKGVHNGKESILVPA